MKINKELMVYSPMEQFEVVSLLSIGGFGFSIDRLTNATLVFVAAIALLVFGMGRISPQNLHDGKIARVPTRWQLLIEWIFDAWSSMLVQTVGAGGPKKYLSLVGGLFFVILAFNLMGLVPYSFAVTSHLSLTLTLAVMVWVGKLITGFEKHGMAFFGLLLPGGVPFAMVPGLVMIELVGFVMQVVSLSVRLFANLMAGHILLKVMAGFGWTMLTAGSIIGWAGHFLPLVVLFRLTGLETGVAMVQAFVFALLTCIYLADVESGGH